jgi:hypothetical protein
MSVGSDWEDNRKGEIALLSRCKRFVLGAPDAPDRGPKDILYFTPCGRWLRVCTRAAYHRNPDAGDGEIAEQVDSEIAGRLFDEYRRPRPIEIDQTPPDQDSDVASELKFSLLETLSEVRGRLAFEPPRDISEIRGASSPIDRNSLIDHLRAWSTGWPEAPPCSPELRNPDHQPGITPESLTPCQRQILLILLNHNQRLTRENVYKKFDQLEERPSDATIRNALADMRKDKLGLLDNSQAERPKGYGLTEEGKRLAARLVGPV